MTQSLTSAQRKYLQKLAHHLKPVAFVGKQGLSDQVVAAVGEVFGTHELIKVKFLDFKDQKHELAEDLAHASDSALAGLIGNIAILYRPHNDPLKREIVLP
jgi:RNA-binding protein